MLNSLTIPTPLPTTASAFLSALVLGICKIIFSWELLYILNSYSIQDLQLPWQYLCQKKREKWREGGREQKKRKVFRVDREITGFIISASWFSLSAMTGRRQACSSLCLRLSGNKLLLGSGLCRTHSLIKWDQTYIPLTSTSLLLRNLKVQRQVP